MCGIFGILNFNAKRLETARSALHVIQHRGPDQWGEHYDDFAYLGHRRLSIRDLSENGRQPFVDRETGVAVVVNGEIWNDKKLRKMLGEERFKGRSDCEVFLHGYIEWGLDNLLSKLDGFYAALIYDPRIESIFLVKDRFGKKPLYYARIGQEWVFASEVKALLSYAPELRVFDYEGIKHWLAYRGSLYGRTIFKDVEKLQAGSYLRICVDGNTELRRHYDLVNRLGQQTQEPPRNIEEFDRTVENLLCSSIEKRFISDVPVGLQLSGGVDSSLVAILTKQVQSASIDTFTVVFSDQKDKRFCESNYAREVAKYCGYRHHEIEIDNTRITDSFEHLVWLFDGMLDIPNAIPIHLLCQSAKKDISVILAGEGADELFGGYGKFSWATKLAKSARAYHWLPDFIFDLPKTKPFIDRRLYSLYLKKYYAGQPDRLLRHLNCFISPRTIERFGGRLDGDLLSGIDLNDLGKLSFDKQVQIVDQITYLNFLLERQDKASMGAAMEARLPFLDQDLVDYIAPLDSHWLFDETVLKKPLKRLLEKHMGHEFTHRSKAGFAIPIERWLDEEHEGLGRYFGEVRKDGFLLWNKFDKNSVLSYIDGHAFAKKQISYGDDERIWLKWFLSVIATAQKVFSIQDIS